DSLQFESVFRPAPYLCALPRNGSPFPALQPRSSRSFFATASFRAHTVTCRALPHSLGTARRRSFPPLNLHRARVPRNRGRLPSSRCIESARTHRARAGALPLRASDTTLRLLRQWPEIEFRRINPRAVCEAPFVIAHNRAVYYQRLAGQAVSSYADRDSA